MACTKAHPEIEQENKKHIPVFGFVPGGSVRFSDDFCYMVPCFNDVFFIAPSPDAEGNGSVEPDSELFFIDFGHVRVLLNGIIFP